MALRILATADLHLGMRFSKYPELQARLAEARFAALERLVARANAEGCGLLVVAGDLFERTSLPQREIQRAAEALNGFEGQAAAVLPGNHDYYAGQTGSLWKSFREKAGDRVLLLTEPRVYDLEHYGLAARLYPGPCTDKHSRENALGWLAGSPPPAARRAPKAAWPSAWPTAPSRVCPPTRRASTTACAGPSWSPPVWTSGSWGTPIAL